METILEDLVERIKKVEGTLNLSLGEFDERLCKIEQQIDTKIGMKEVEFLRTLRRDLDEQIKRIEKSVVVTDWDEEKQEMFKIKGQSLVNKATESGGKFFLPKEVEKLERRVIL